MTCETKCTSVDDILVRVARQLGDYSDEDTAGRFVTWSRNALTDYYNEAVQMMVANRPDAFGETVDITLRPGSTQAVPAGYRALADIDHNITNGGDASSVVAGDEYFSRIMAAKSCFVGQCVGPDRTYQVKSFAKSKFAEGEFSVSPPVPPGMAPVVRATLVRSPRKVCGNETAECVQFDPVYSGAVVEWMLYRAWGSDAEIVGGANAAALHFKAFFQMLGVQMQREHQFHNSTPPERATR